MPRSLQDFNEIPGPALGSSPLGAYRLLQQIRRDVLSTIQTSFDNFGDVLRFSVLGKNQVMLRHPAHVREVLVEHADCYVKGDDYTDRRKGLAKFVGAGLLTSNGALWKRQRRLVSSALSPRRLAGYAASMTASIDRSLDRYAAGDTVDISETMMSMTLEIVGSALFHEDMSSEVRRVAKAMNAVHGMIAANNSALTLLPSWLPTLQRHREKQAVRELDAIVYGLIRSRRPTVDAPLLDRGDLCSTFLLATDETGARMSDEQVRDEIVTMFLAGHETTANALSWAWLLLAAHAEAQKQLHEELDSALGSRTPTYDDIERLPFATAVIKEALRLYPPVFLFKRTSVKATSIGGYAIPAGVDVTIVPYATQRDPRFHDRPNDFIPPRFLSGVTVDKYAWLPFGAGPRVCVGAGFAMIESVLILAKLAQHFQPVLLPHQSVQPEPGATLRPKAPLKMRLEARHQP